MSSPEPLSLKTQENGITDDLSSHKFNLFQQFFVVGLDPKLSYNLYKIDLKLLPKELSSPKIISKYPNCTLPYINIPDPFVASHCFPKGFLDKIIYYKDEELNEKYKTREEWVFSLDNLEVQDYSSSLRTNKVYYTCLLFYEKISNFKNLSNYRRKMSFKSEEILEEEKNKNMLIPKVICLSSFKPLFMKAAKILRFIKIYYDKCNFEALFDKDNFYPIENIIEEIIYSIPGLPRGNFIIRLNCGFFFGEDKLNLLNRKSVVSNINVSTNNKIEMIFDESPINKSPKAIINYSLLLTFFTVEEIFDIIRSIILEEPILFFCEDIFNLTYTIEGLLALIYPFSYTHPVVSVLPEENFSFINVFYHFIFGINYKYSEELWKEKFEYLGDKQKIVIIPIEIRFPNFLNDIENKKTSNYIIKTKFSNSQTPLVQLTHLSNYKNKSKKETSDKNLKITKLPIHYSSKCIKRLEPLIISKLKERREIAQKNNKELKSEEKDQICNKEVVDNFLYFFTCILLNYQEFFKVKYEKIKNPNNDSSSDKDNIAFRRPEEIEMKNIRNELIINDMFNTTGFIANTPALDRPFYEKFFKTQMFYNFIKKKLFPISVKDKLDILFFDDKINEKLSREINLKKIDIKFLEDKCETISGDISVDPMKKEISEETKTFFEDKHNCEKALNYFQYIIKDINTPPRKTPPRNFSSESSFSQDGIFNNLYEDYSITRFKFYYFVFPKLLNDGIFFQNRKKETKKDENKLFRYNNFCFYNVFEKEGIKIVNNPVMTSNYKNYNYSLNPMKFRLSNYVNYTISVNKLWLHLLAKTFYNIPNNQKLYYFYQIMKFLREKQQIIDDNTLFILFKAFYKFGDKNIIREFFINFNRRKTAYTPFLFLKDKVKKRNNFIEYRSLAEKDHKIEDKFIFIINSFCTKIEEKKDPNNKSLFNVCGEQTIEEIYSMFNEKEKYMKFECNKESNKIPNKQPIIISCFYDKGDSLRYQINFRLITPSFILRQNWFANTDSLNIEFMRKEYLECYLSAIFYFHKQGLIFDFLLPKTNQKRDLFIENIAKDNNIINQEIILGENKENKKNEDDIKKEDKIEENKTEADTNEEIKKEEDKIEVDIKEEMVKQEDKIEVNIKEEMVKEENKKEEQKKENKKEDIREKLFMSTNVGLDLGGLDIEFSSSPPESKKMSKSPKKSQWKKKQSNTFTLAEFKLLNLEESK